VPPITTLKDTLPHRRRKKGGRGGKVVNGDGILLFPKKKLKPGR